MLRKLLRPQSRAGKARLALLVGIVSTLIGVPLGFLTHEDRLDVYHHTASEAGTNDASHSLLTTNGAEKLNCLPIR